MLQKVRAIALVALLALVPLALLPSAGADEPAARAVVVPPFTNVANALGVQGVKVTGDDPAHPLPASAFNTWHDWLKYLHMEGGAAWGDIDGDGFEELYLTHDGPDQLFANNGDGTFTDITAAAGVATAGRTYGAAFGDCDGDGDVDLYVSQFYGPHTLYRNNGDGTFSNITVSARIVGKVGGTGVSWADYDGDGDLDIYVTVYLKTANLLWRNDGDCTFTDVAAAVGVADAGYSFQALWTDHDQDGDVDLYVINDFAEDSLFINEGDGTFSNFSRLCQCDGGSGGGMGSVTGDVDNDGWFDWYVANFRRNYLWHNEEGFLMTEVGQASHSADGNVGWGDTMQDFNNDGWLDIYQNNGLVESGSHPLWQPANLFLNTGSLAEVPLFEDHAADATLADGSVGRGASSADYDHDGDVDIYRVNLDNDSRLYRNDLDVATHHWLEVDLHAPGGNPSAIGARLQLRAGGEQQWREVRSGSGYLGADMITAHFGLGAVTLVDSLRIFWPDGGEQQLTDIAADQRLSISPDVPLLAHVGPDQTIGEDVAVTLDPEPTEFFATDGSGATSHWDVATLDGSVSYAIAAPTHTFADPGLYRVELTVTDTLGNSDRDVAYYRVLDSTEPVAVAGEDVIIDQGETVVFNGGLSTDNHPWFAFDATFRWTLSESNGAVELDGVVDTYTFVKPGDFTVTLEVTDPDGNTDLDTLQVWVNDLDSPKLGPFQDLWVDEDTNVTLVASMVFDNDPELATRGTFRWTIPGPELPTTLWGYSVTYVFPDPGVQMVLLTVIDTGGHAINTTLNVTVADLTLPQVVLPATLTVDEDEPFVLDASGTSDNHPDFSTQGRFVWTLPTSEGVLTLGGPSPTLKLEQPGSYLATLKVTDPDGNSANGSVQITVRDRTAPVCWDPSIDECLQMTQWPEDTPLPLYIDLRDNDPTFDPATDVRWQITTANGTLTRIGASTEVTFADPGSVSLVVTATDPSGNSLTLPAVLLTISDITAPVVRIDGPSEGQVGTLLTLQAVVTDNDGAFPTGASFRWTVVDQGLDPLRYPGHSYTLEGAQLQLTPSVPQPIAVNLTVTDGSGNSRSATLDLPVLASPAGGDHTPGPGPGPGNGTHNGTGPGPIDPVQPTTPLQGGVPEWAQVLVLSLMASLLGAILLVRLLRVPPPPRKGRVAPPRRPTPRRAPPSPTRRRGRPRKGARGAQRRQRRGTRTR